MGKMRDRFNRMSLKSSFVTMVAVAVFIILVTSALSVYICMYLQNLILPASNEAWLTVWTEYKDGTVSEAKQRIEFNCRTELYQLIDEGGQDEQAVSTSYNIEKINNSVAMLSPKRKVAYQILVIAMVILPVIYSLIGVTFCAWYFYRNKLEPPLNILSAATNQICNHNLDFAVSYDSGDEMGQLCRAFEQMRKALYENNQELWNMVEERKELQASVAHDLRNPIAILKGYAEYLQQCTCNGKLNLDKVSGIADNLIKVARRMERYTNSIQDINNLESLEIKKITCILPEMIEEIAKDFYVVALLNHLHFSFVNTAKPGEITVDKQVLYRVLENIFMNAIRFAKTRIQMQCSMNHQKLSICITDDGDGFSEETLQKRKLFLEDLTGEHMGMGLLVSRILCKKHGGSCSIDNLKEGGAKVLIEIFVA